MDRLPPQNLQFQPDTPANRSKMLTTRRVIDVDPDQPMGLGLLAVAVLQQEKTVPQEAIRRIPAERTPVSGLIAANLPRSSHHVLRSAKSCLSAETPNWTDEHLREARVPPRDWLGNLDIALDRNCSGIRSVEAPSGLKGRRSPLWVGNFWLQVTEAIEQKERWERARGWLQRMVRSPEIREVEGLLERTPWGLGLWSLIGHNQLMKVGFLAEFLSNEWLAERHIDTLVAYVGDRLRRSNRPDTTLVADVHLANLFSRKRGETATKSREDQEPRTYAGKILDGRRDHLLFPGHIGGSKTGHWIVFSVKIKERTISYGEFSHKQGTGCTYS